MIFTFLRLQKFSTTAKSLPKKMVRVLNVAEKNDAAKSLAAVLSQGRSRKREGFSQFNKIYEFEYRFMNQQVTMSMTSVSGHLLGLEFTGLFKKWNACNPVDLFNVPVEKYCPQNYNDIKRTLEREIRGCQTLVIWTDCDREGENIGFEIIQVCQAVKPNIKVYRAKFSEITPHAVQRAINNLIPPDKRVNDAVDVRQELDLRIGAAFTRFQTLRLQKIFPQALAEQLISYGSCQFPTLGFVVERYKQVQEFVPEPFWKIKVQHQHDGVKADFSWKRNRLFNYLACQVLFDQCIENPKATVVEVKSKSKNKWRPQALDTVELEKLASRKLKINAKETMKIAEKLYTQGFISYPRTETNQFPKELDLVPLVEEQTRDPDWGAFAQGVLQQGPNPRNGTKTDNAHPPIHPLKYTDTLQGNEKKVYEFVVRHFLACVSQDAQGHETVVEIDIADERFSTQGLMILARNYLDVYPYEKWSAKEVPLYRQGDQFEPNSIEIVAGETSAPSLLTEADLIALMDKHGIGTDATHADHIETVKSRMYVGLRPDGTFVPGQLGMGLVEGYDSMGYEMSKPNLRAELEADLKLICEGRKTKEEVLQVQIQKYKDVFVEACRQAQKLDEALSQYLGDAQALPENEGGEVDSAPSVVRKCPKCGNLMVLRTRKEGKGFYIGCAAYPDCKCSIWLPDFVTHVKTTDEICETCQPNPITKLQFKFKPGSVPMTIPNNYVGCIGGCDEMLNETLGIRPLTGPAQGNNPLHPRTEISVISPRATGPTNNGRTTINNRSTQQPGRPQAVRSNNNNRLGGSNNRQGGFGSSSPNGPTSSRNFHTQNTLPFGGRPSPPTHHNGFGQGAQRGGGLMVSGANKTVITNQNSRTFGPSLSGFSGPRGPNNPTASPGSYTGSGGDEDRDKAIVCSCGRDAVMLTVRKEGPNTGRQFYKCSGNNGENCNFFLWADNSDENQSNIRTNNANSRTNSGFNNSPQLLNVTNHRPGANRNNSNSGNRTSSNNNNNNNSIAAAGDVQCPCGLPAKFLTVMKQGPNTGRQFHACSKPRDQSCNFFQWADEASSGPSGGHAPWPSAGRGGNGKKRAAPSDGSTPKQRKPPTCGYCGKPGHKKPKCPEKQDGF